MKKKKGVSDCDSCFDHAPFSTKVCCYYMMTHSIFSLLNQSIDCDDGEDNKQSPDQGWPYDYISDRVGTQNLDFGLWKK